MSDLGLTIDVHCSELGCRLQINHVSTALVSILLVPNMARAAREHNSHSRLVIVCSGLHASARPEKVTPAPNMLHALNDAQYCSKPETMGGRYNDTKCASPTHVLASMSKCTDQAH